MALLRRVCLLINILSVDVAIAAMGGMFFFASFLDVEVPISVYLGLGIVVWGIYMLDHLLDARAMDTAADEPRRSFYLRHSKVIWLALLFCAATALILVGMDQMLQHFLPYAAVLGVLAVGTWIFGKYAGSVGAWTKELLIALIYTAGISVFPISQNGLQQLSSLVFLYLLGFFMLALLNLWILSYWDRESDKLAGFSSIASVSNPIHLQRAIVTLGIIINLLFFGALLFQPSFYHMHASVILMISHIHVLVFLTSKKDRQLKRQILEASFLFSWMLLLVA
jgi:4-hydroxybenzoate polyprenyltransferase